MYDFSSSCHVFFLAVFVYFRLHCRIEWSAFLKQSTIPILVLYEDNCVYDYGFKQKPKPTPTQWKSIWLRFFREIFKRHLEFCNEKLNHFRPHWLRHLSSTNFRFHISYGYISISGTRTIIIKDRFAWKSYLHFYLRMRTLTAITFKNQST